MANEPGKVNPRDTARQINSRNILERRRQHFGSGPHGPSQRKVLRPLVLEALALGPATSPEIVRRIGGGTSDGILDICKNLERDGKIFRVNETQRLASPYAPKRNGVSLAPITWALKDSGVSE